MASTVYVDNKTNYHMLWQREFGFNVCLLTAREIEILSYMARGFLNKQIASHTNITEQTAKNHVSNILRKLDANNRTEAVVKAASWGIVSLNPATN